MTVKQHLPNLITCLRLIGTVGLLFTRPLSESFFVVYIFTGLTDVLDGFLARLTKTTSEFGAKLDSIADLLFYGVMLIKLMPILRERLTVGVWIAIGAVLIVRTVAYAAALIRYHRFASLHTYLNKLTGASVFLYPFALLLPIAVPAACIVCGIAIAASVEEFLIHLLSPEYASGVKTIFFRSLEK